MLSIDAHTRFEPGWDEVLLSMLAQCPSAKPPLSTYPAPYTLPDERDRNGIMKMAFREFVVDAPGAAPKLVYQTYRIAPEAMPIVRSRPRPSATASSSRAPSCSTRCRSICASTSSATTSRTRRARTSGWDFYSPNRPVLYHLWDRSKRPGHWSDQPGRASRLREQTQRRVAHLVGSEQTSDAEALAELDRYGLCSVRGLGEYQEISGVDFARKAVSARARRGDVGPDPDALAATVQAAATAPAAVTIASAPPTVPAAVVAVPAVSARLRARAARRRESSSTTSSPRSITASCSTSRAGWTTTTSTRPARCAARGT